MDTKNRKEAEDVCRVGYDDLWRWFSCSRASWLVLPRAAMHEMPDPWQKKMAELLDEWDSTINSSDLPEPSVLAKNDGKFCKWPEWLLNYRHPNKKEINKIFKSR